MSEAETSVREVLAKYVERVWNDHDVEAFADFSDDSVHVDDMRYEDEGPSPEDLQDRLRRIFELSPDHEVRILDTISEGNYVVWTYEMSGSWVLANREPSFYRVRGIAFYGFRDGIVIKRAGVMERLKMSYQIGELENLIDICIPV
ncbi:hypothetical protein RxyAA322_12970 [Rubrobacter xylanophilus]|uniref:SnoaL-like domain-containing protein n=1 Tax=Rubrobacter xylanophilus TaxID=49319 RepID=A0A510HLI3_9ACTN|nr:nuclear transport factor 2 family protein [Rubrobacter xylanophilus]BBL79443.1 hypothetical protein RxyAA322_12970 [Rubrobacter xylanophilus]